MKFARPCDVCVSMSGDNYEEYANKFNIKNYKDFSKNQYFKNI